MIFKFVVRHLGILKYIPFLAGVVDAIMMIWNSVLHPELTNAIEKIEIQISRWPGITLSPHKFGGIQFNYEQKEIGHIHSNGILDILFSKKIKHDLIGRANASDHHVFSQSGWVSFYIRSENDVDNAIELLALSYRQKTQLLHMTSSSIPISSGAHT